MPGAKKKKWHTQDLDWDEDGNLYIKNAKLAQQIFDAIWTATNSHYRLRIVRDDPDWENADDGGVGNPKQNMQCPC